MASMTNDELQTFMNRLETAIYFGDSMTELLLEAGRNYFRVSFDPAGRSHGKNGIRISLDEIKGSPQRHLTRICIPRV